MQLLTDASIGPVAPSPCAKRMMEAVPLVMQFIRRQMRQHRVHGVTVPQLRTLYYISIHDRPSLSDAAEFIGLSLPAMSRLVDGLVKKSMLTRTPCLNDRRHVRLGITPAGRAALDASWKATHNRLAREIAALGVEQRGIVNAAMEILNAAFDPDVVSG